MADKPRLAALLMKEAWRRARRHLRAGSLHRWLLPAATAERLLVAPPDLRRGDPILAEDIYAGRFYFAGELVEAAGRSPFQVIPPTRAWAVELQSFEWLRHLAECGDALAAGNARSLVSEWIATRGNGVGGLGYDPEVTARRIVAWMAHSPTILDGADYAFYRRFLKSLCRQTRYLRSIVGEAPEGLPRLRARIALAFASLCLPTGGGQMRSAARALNDELNQQIFPDGGHVSRNPAVIPEIAALLLPLRQTFSNQSHPVPKGVFSAIDRMLPTLRFFRHVDGTLALFNGASVSELQLMTALLRYDETLGEPISFARQSGYQRLAAGGTVLIADTGAPPAPHLSGEAHAGTLAFELSSGRSRIVVNCGAPAPDEAQWRRFARATAAHSTITIGDRSSSRFASSDLIERFLGTPLIAGPDKVSVAREDGDDGQGFTAGHDGYLAPFGLKHERSIFLSRDGRLVQGVDRLLGAHGRAARPPQGHAVEAVARFHLHPSVHVSRVGRAVRLATREQVWHFTANHLAEIEDSVFFAASGGARRTLQLAIAFDPYQEPVLEWSFRRDGPEH
ncbi:heparinase II/III family protein [Aurantimonas sp. MSK8Z-1]|uniref:heparinase II/III family protein n=1 Tax=Mangrovibrevibacter kandeliae TaxID=2968473 RepID=UPI002118EC3C|nr:heparinase II/III family protein [Aurantimonas sp. MSK8Z-1]MCW4117079.1 heparinase II/III family protein [Aurantimonas sp. MSK8Z-1]